MPKFRIPIMWEMIGFVEVVADSKEQLEKLEIKESDLPQNAQVHSISVATEAAEEIN